MMLGIHRGYVDVPWGQLHYAALGQGRAVVLIHQTPRSWDEFRDVLPRAGRLGEFREWTNDRLETVAGNGGHEIRAWIIAAAAAGNAPGRRLSYNPVEEWLTGMAVAAIEPGDGLAYIEIADRERAKT